MNFNSSDLPNGCHEIRATGSPGGEWVLEHHIDDLPAITQERVDQLSRVALRAQGGSWGRGPGTTVLRVSDLLRQTATGRFALHPRVVQVVPVSSLDALLRAISRLYEGDRTQNAFQYPDTLIECRCENPEKDALYPPAYDVTIADIARGLRQNSILTSVRHPGESRLPLEDRRAAVEEMEMDGVSVLGSVTVHQPSDEPQPQLYVDRFTPHQTPPSAEEFRDICFRVCRNHNLLLELIEDSAWGDSSL